LQSRKDKPIHHNYLPERIKEHEKRLVGNLVFRATVFDINKDFTGKKAALYFDMSTAVSKNKSTIKTPTITFDGVEMSNRFLLGSIM